MLIYNQQNDTTIGMCYINKYKYSRTLIYRASQGKANMQGKSGSKIAPDLQNCYNTYIYAQYMEPFVYRA